MYFASYQHYFYYILFWGLILLVSIHVIEKNNFNGYRYYGAYIGICLLYILMNGYYGVHTYLPKARMMSLSKANSFLPTRSNLPKDSNNGFTFYSKFYVTNFDFNFTSRVFSAPGLFTVEYDGVSGNLMINIESKMHTSKMKSLSEQSNPGAYGAYDNVLIIKDIPLQRYNELFLICNQDKCYVYFNERKYVINIDFYPQRYYGSILVGSDKGLTGKVKDMLYLPHSIPLDLVSKVRKMNRNRNKYMLGVVPYL
jgi:hypothetical protein